MCRQSSSFVEFHDVADKIYKSALKPAPSDGVQLVNTVRIVYEGANAVVKSVVS